MTKPKRPKKPDSEERLDEERVGPVYDVEFGCPVEDDLSGDIDEVQLPREDGAP